MIRSLRDHDEPAPLSAILRGTWIVLGWVPLQIGILGCWTRAMADEALAPPHLALLLQGLVQDGETKRPLAGASIRVHRFLSGAGRDQAPAGASDTTLTADARGRFKIVFPSSQVADARLHVELHVSHPGYFRIESGPVSLAALDLRRRCGDRPLLGTISLDRQREYAIRVQTPDGQPAAGVPFEISSEIPSEGFTEFRFFPEAVRGRTDAQGWIRACVRPIDMNLTITPEHLAARRFSWAVDGGEPTRKEVLPSNLGRVQLEPGIVVSGRLLDLAGRPMPRQMVVAQEVQTLCRRSAVTGPDGRFSFAPLAPGQYLIRGDRQIAQEWRLDQLPLPSTAPVIKPVWLELKQEMKPGPVELREVETVQVVVRQVDPSGRPVRGLPVAIDGVIVAEPEKEFANELPEDVFGDQPAPGFSDGPLADESLLWGVQNVPDADGKVVFRVPRGLGTVAIIADPPVSTSIRTRLSKSGPLEPRAVVELDTVNEDRRDITLVHYRAATVLVTIKSDQDQVPDDAVILVEHAPVDFEGSIVQFADGRYCVANLIPDESYTITAGAEGYARAEAKVKLPEGGYKELTLEIKRQVGDGLKAPDDASPPAP
jgi:hypothetical protein